MRKSKVDASALLIILIAVLFAGGVIFTVSALRPDPVRDFLAGDRLISVLFVIENGDTSNPKPLGTYVLMYYPATRRAAIFDIPGSLGMIIQRINRVDRIDAVYDPRRITPFKNEVERLLGLEISFSVVISLENLGRITDLIRGVDVFIPSPVDEYHNGRILFPSGVVRLDGAKAKLFISYELPDENSEMANSRRQRFFVSFLQRLGEQNQFLNKPQVTRLFHSFAETGLNKRAQMRLFDVLAGIDAGRLSIQTVGGNVREVSGQDLIFPHWDGSLIREIVRHAQDTLIQPGEALGSRGFTVEILNGTTVTGLAARTAELFRSFGFDVIAIGNADRNDVDRTVIIDRSGLDDMVRSFADVIRCTNIRHEGPGFSELDLEHPRQNFGSRANLTLILGRDFNGRFVTE